MIFSLTRLGRAHYLSISSAEKTNAAYSRHLVLPGTRGARPGYRDHSVEHFIQSAPGNSA